MNDFTNENTMENNDVQPIVITDEQILTIVRNTMAFCDRGKPTGVTPNGRLETPFWLECMNFLAAIESGQLKVTVVEKQD
jgi:hypothetical protein